MIKVASKENIIKRMTFWLNWIDHQQTMIISFSRTNNI